MDLVLVLMLHREYAQTVASHVGMLTMSQLGAAERRKEWNREVAELRSTCQVSSVCQEKLKEC